VTDAACPPVLHTDRLLLRPVTLHDAEAVYSYASDPRVTRFMIWETHRSVEDARAFLREVLRAYEEGGLSWGIVHRADDRFVGTCGLEVVREHARAELGYVLHRGYWGRGLMPEAVRAVIRHGFEREGMERIQARCAVENAASARVMEKAGMSYEGTLRRYERIGGALRDMKFYAILREEHRPG